jgi:hypothetical protein
LKSRKLSFAVLLPVADLIVWLVIVLAPALLFYRRLHLLGRSGAVEMGFGEIQVTLPPNKWLAFSFETICMRRFHTVANINLPGALFGSPLTIPVIAALRHSGVPFGIQIWYTVTLPFFCLPIWWFVGRGLDRLLAGERSSASAVVFGSACFIGCTASLIALLTASPTDRTDLFPYVPGLILWTLASGVFPVGWLLGRRGRQRASSSSN